MILCLLLAGGQGKERCSFLVFKDDPCRCVKGRAVVFSSSTRISTGKYAPLTQLPAPIAVRKFTQLPETPAISPLSSSNLDGNLCLEAFTRSPWSYILVDQSLENLDRSMLR